ncbi:MAG: metallophosphoesterase [Bacteroidetes bacterium]|nr:metallophosphoesterase [Bacteroidota bacterium]
MVLLYVWPGDVRNSTNYILYSIFNGILFIDLIFKIPQSILFLTGFLFPKGFKRQTISWIGIIISGFVSSVLLYGILFGKNEVAVQEIELEFKNLPESFDGYKVVQISDIHLGSFTSQQVLRKTQKQIQTLQPDLLLFTGDLVNNFSQELKGWDSVFHGINGNTNSFSILGNHDYGDYSNWENDTDRANNFQSITEAHKKFGFQLLRNQNITLLAGSDSIYLIGVENWGHPPFPQYANLKQAFSGIPDNSFKILMTHDPAHWESQIKDKENIELSLSGHTHALQWGVKTAGIPFSLSYFIRKNWGGLYKSNNSYLYVNTGLGTVGIPYRIDIPAEITLITLKRIKVD